MSTTVKPEPPVVTLDRIRPQKLDEVSRSSVAGIIQRVLRTDQADALDVAQFNSAI